MKLKQFLLNLRKSSVKYDLYIPSTLSDYDEELTGIVCDSRQCGNGIVFAATKGGTVDAHDYIPQAESLGTRVVLCEHRVDYNVIQIITENVRSSMGLFASIIFENPSEKMSMIALTGTNGKTTSTFMIREILNASGIKTGLIGTIIYDDGCTVKEANHTTPEGADLQTLLSSMVKNDCRACVMEVSSHALIQGRVRGIKYDRAGFTNLSVDHLDFHKTMENYFLAKKSLFDNYMRGSWKASINVDDAYAERLYSEYRENSLSYSVNDKTADFFAQIGYTDAAGIHLSLHTAGKDYALTLPMWGSYNVSNALQAISIACSLGVSPESAVHALSDMSPVPGRLERYRITNDAVCVIDFAHTPDGLEKVLSAVRPVCKGKLITVFGAGGDRDTTKRPIMGRIASELSDKVVITSDNPRSEDPHSIITDIYNGVSNKNICTLIDDRREGIYAALDSAGSDDFVVIAGRGPETHQILKHGPVPLVDKEIFRDWLDSKGYGIL